jgi:hypothetical protein
MASPSSLAFIRPLEGVNAEDTQSIFNLRSTQARVVDAIAKPATINHRSGYWETTYKRDVIKQLFRGNPKIV